MVVDGERVFQPREEGLAKGKAVGHVQVCPHLIQAIQYSWSPQCLAECDNLGGGVGKGLLLSRYSEVKMERHRLQLRKIERISNLLKISATV